MKSLFLFSFTILTFICSANNGASEIYVNLQKLHSLKRVLYVAAHPDDENTRALAWLSLGEKAETAYFSLTRGDGGQNLIGNELSERLGVLRTQELLAARSYDGAKQFFSRAVDFGYSKSATESFEKWGKDEVLSDLVLMIRKFKPDAIITRFPPDKRAGHGHHTASALLAIEAFEKAADPSFLPEQVKQFGTWKSTSLYWNTSYWWDENIKDMSEGDPNYLITDIGGYNAALGMSYNEIGTLARSQHKCQGFGAIIERGSRTEYFKHMKGEKLKHSFFEKSERSWSAMVNNSFEKQFQATLDNFDFVTVENNVPALLKILEGLESIPASFIRDEKIDRCKQIIADCLGLHMEFLGDDFAFLNGQDATLSLNLLNRSSLYIQLLSVQTSENDRKTFSDTLLRNKMVKKEFMLNRNAKISNPYWLESPFTNLFEVADERNLGKAESDPAVGGIVQLSIDGVAITFEVPATFKWREPSYGERERMLISAPEFSASFEESLSLIKPESSKTIRVKVHAFKDSLNDQLHINAPKGWTVSPSSVPIQLAQKHDEIWIEFTLRPEKNSEDGTVSLKNNDGTLLQSYTEIAYDHIPTQVIFSPSALSCKKLDVKINKGMIAYIKGVEDAVPQAIEQLGFDVTLLEVNDLSSTDLSIYQSVVLGIRIYNVHPELTNFSNQLNTYVKEGGNLVMQYNTASRSVREMTLGPVPFELSRKRVTEEDAEVTFLAPKHPIMNTPNKIEKNDFDGWVQERGLYFADNWDSSYTPLFSWADKGSDPVEGSLIVTQYGEGQFTYAGISFFRELPNGVIGAYRLFANILSFQR